MRASIFPLLLKIVAFFLVFMLILTLPAALLTFNLQKNLMNPEPYKTVFSEQGLYHQIPELLAIQLVQSDSDTPTVGQEGSSQLFGFLDEAEITLILEEVVTDEWSKAQVETLIDAWFAFLNGDTEQFQVSIYLEELKSALNGPESDKIFDLMIESMPPCTAEDLESVILNVLVGGEIRLPICALPEEILSISKGLVEDLLTPLVDSIPATLFVSLSHEDFNVPDPSQPGQTKNFVDDYRSLRRIFRLGPLIVILLLALIAAFAVRTWRGLLRWWGWPLFLGSAFVLCPVLASGSAMVTRIEDFVFLRAPAAFSSGLVNTLTEIVGQIATRTMLSIGVQAVLLMSAGFAMIVVDFLLGRRERTEPAAADTAG